MLENKQSYNATKYPKGINIGISLGEFGSQRAIGQVSGIACADQYSMTIPTGNSFLAQLSEF